MLASIAAIGIVLSPDRRQVLIVKRRDVPIWVLPGGGVETGESSKEAVLREITEETGIRAEVVRKVASYTPVPPFATHTDLYECIAIDGVTTTTDESCAVGFFPLDQLPYPFFPVHQHLIDDTLKADSSLIIKPVPGVGWGYFLRYLVTHPALIGRYVLARLGLPINS